MAPAERRGNEWNVYSNQKQKAPQEAKQNKTNPHGPTRVLLASFLPSCFFNRSLLLFSVGSRSLRPQNDLKILLFVLDVVKKGKERKRKRRPPPPPPPPALLALVCVSCLSISRSRSCLSSLSSLSLGGLFLQVCLSNPNPACLCAYMMNPSRRLWRRDPSVRRHKSVFHAMY